MYAVSIVVPTYNEAENIDLLLNRIFAVQQLRELNLEVVFSDGASTDATCECIEKWVKTHRVRLVRSSVNEGLSAAVMAGARAASGEFVVVMDADLSHPPEAIPELLLPLLAGTCDMVIGSRYTKGGGTPEWPLTRKISSRIATLPARLLTDVKDPLAGFLAMRRERLAMINREVCGFKIGLELLATGEDEMRVKEVPIVFRDRCYGTSKMSVQVVVDYCRQLLILAGIDILPCRFQELFLTCLAVLITDCAVLTMLLESGSSPGAAHCYSFVSAGLLGGGIVYYRHLRKKQNIALRRHTEYIVGFLWVLLLTILLRSGLVAMLVDNHGGLTTAMVFWVGLFGLTTGYLGDICYVFSIGRKRIRGALVQRFYGLGAAAFLVLLRLLYCGSVDLLPEEKYYGNILSFGGSLSAVLSAPASAMAGAFGRLFPGNPVFVFRFGVWLLWLMASVCFFSLARDMYNRSVAFMAFLIFAALPFFFGAGLFVSADAILLFFWCCSLYALYQALVGGVGRAWIWSGIALGFGIQANGQLIVLAAGVIGYLLLSRDGKKWFSTPMPYQALGAMLLTVIPALLFGGQGAVETAYGGPRWLDSLIGEQLSRNYLIAIVLLTPTGLLAGGCTVVTWLRDDAVVQAKSEHGCSRNRTFLLTMFLVPLAIYLGLGIFAKWPVYESSVVWLVLLPAMALSMGRKKAAGNGCAALLAVLWWPTIGILMVGYGLALHLAVL